MCYFIHNSVMLSWRLKWPQFSVHHPLDPWALGGPEPSVCFSAPLRQASSVPTWTRYKGGAHTWCDFPHFYSSHLRRHLPKVRRKARHTWCKSRSRNRTCIYLRKRVKDEPCSTIQKMPETKGELKMSVTSIHSYSILKILGFGAVEPT